MDKTKSICLSAIMGIFPFFYGLSYEFAVFFAAGILAAVLLWILHKEKRLVLYINKRILALLLIAAGNAIAIFAGVEKGISLLGFFKVLAMVVWVLLLMQLSEKEQEDAMGVIPFSGAAMTLICGVCFFIPGGEELLFSSGRMGGFFQYSNTFALFLLMGIVILAYGEKKRGSALVFALLFAGILWSGSRTTFLFALAAVIFLAFRRKAYRRQLLALLGGAVLFGGIFVLVTGNVDNIGRFLTVSPFSSTFLGRILYSIDGAKLLIKHPLGLGYLGYYFMEPAIQHGVYNVRFIHNDWLQLGLDGGFLALAAFVYLVAANLKKREGAEAKRLVLLLISLHMFFEFDLEFFYIVMCVLLCMDFKTGKTIYIACK